jgi:glycosyltransferase involved in cell wall biosynthesis
MSLVETGEAVSRRSDEEIEKDRGANLGPSFSFIIEWDNARLSELGRARQMLQILQQQVVAHRPKPDKPPQIVILYDKNRVDPAIIQQVLDETIDDKAWDAVVKLVPTDGLGYYELKNYGVLQSDSDVTLFIDSDVIPEPGWFDSLMGAIEQPAVQVVGGSTYVKPDHFLAKAFGIFWFYDIRSEGVALHDHYLIYANNVAFKTQFLKAHPFPSLESFRGQCRVLSDDLRREGVTIYRHDGARVMHPTTNGLGHFLCRAICEGHDVVTIGREMKLGRLHASPLGALGRYGRDMKSMIGRTIRNRRDVGLSVPGAVAAAMVGATYNSFKFFGEIVTFFSPGLVRRYWPI